MKNKLNWIKILIKSKMTKKQEAYYINEFNKRGM